MLVLLSRNRRKGAWSSRGHREYRSHPKKCASEEEEVEKKNGKSSMAEQNGRTKTKTAAVAATGTAAAMTVNGGAGVAGSEFVEGWTLAQTLGEGAYGE